MKYCRLSIIVLFVFVTHLAPFGSAPAYGDGGYSGTAVDDYADFLIDLGSIDVAEDADNNGVNAEGVGMDVATLSTLFNVGLYPNGILDIYEFALLEDIAANSSAVQAAWQTNENYITSLIGPETVPYWREASSSIPVFGVALTLGDEGSAALVEAMIEYYFGVKRFSRSNCNLSHEAVLSARGDADGDGYTNEAEFKYAAMSFGDDLYGATGNIASYLSYATSNANVPFADLDLVESFMRALGLDPDNDFALMAYVDLNFSADLEGGGSIDLGNCIPDSAELSLLEHFLKNPQLDFSASDDEDINGATSEEVIRRWFRHFNRLDATALGATDDQKYTMSSFGTFSDMLSLATVAWYGPEDAALSDTDWDELWDDGYPLSADGDADGDGFSNRDEWEWQWAEHNGTFSSQLLTDYAAAAADDTSYPSGTYHTVTLRTEVRYGSSFVYQNGGVTLPYMLPRKYAHGSWASLEDPLSLQEDHLEFEYFEVSIGGSLPNTYTMTPSYFQVTDDATVTFVCGLDEDYEVTLEDSVLLGAVKDKLGKGANDVITAEDVADITTFQYIGNEYTGQTPTPNTGCITSLAGFEPLHNMTDLRLPYNEISDLHELCSLANINYLDLRHNNIREIADLVDARGWGEGDTLILYDNPLCMKAVCYDIPALRARGVQVFAHDLALAPDGPARTASYPKLGDAPTRAYGNDFVENQEQRMAQYDLDVAITAMYGFHDIDLSLVRQQNPDILLTAYASGLTIGQGWGRMEDFYVPSVDDASNYYLHDVHGLTLPYEAPGIPWFLDVHCANMYKRNYEYADALATHCYNKYILGGYDGVHFDCTFQHPPYEVEYSADVNEDGVSNGCARILVENTGSLTSAYSLEASAHGYAQRLYSTKVGETSIGGSFTLTFKDPVTSESSTTDAIDANASAEDIAQALNDAIPGTEEVVRCAGGPLSMLSPWGDVAVTFDSIFSSPNPIKTLTANTGTLSGMAVFCEAEEISVPVSAEAAGTGALTLSTNAINLSEVAPAAEVALTFSNPATEWTATSTAPNDLFIEPTEGTGDAVLAAFSISTDALTSDFLLGGIDDNTGVITCVAQNLTSWSLPFCARIDNEVIVLDALLSEGDDGSGAVFHIADGCRGFRGTIAAAHSSGATVEVVAEIDIVSGETVLGTVTVNQAVLPSGAARASAEALTALAGVQTPVDLQYNVGRDYHGLFDVTWDLSLSPTTAPLTVSPASITFNYADDGNWEDGIEHMLEAIREKCSQNTPPLNPILTGNGFSNWTEDCTYYQYSNGGLYESPIGDMHYEDAKQFLTDEEKATLDLSDDNVKLVALFRHLQHNIEVCTDRSQATPKLHESSFDFQYGDRSFIEARATWQLTSMDHRRFLLAFATAAIRESYFDISSGGATFYAIDPEHPHDSGTFWLDEFNTDLGGGLVDGGLQAVTISGVTSGTGYRGTFPNGYVLINDNATTDWNVTLPDACINISVDAENLAEAPKVFSERTPSTTWTIPAASARIFIKAE